MVLQVSPQERNPSELDPTTQEATHSALDTLDLQPTFDMSNSPTVTHFPHSALELRRAETTTSASLPGAHLQADPLEHFSENHDVACQVAGICP
jgi:hypothetical protein